MPIVNGDFAMPRAALAFTLAAVGALTLGGCANAPRDTAAAPLTAEQSEKLPKSCFKSCNHHTAPNLVKY